MRQEIKEVEYQVSERLLLLCEKCGSKKLIEGENAALVLQKWMKEEIREGGLKEKLRPVLSSCLGLCPEDRITAGLLSTHGNQPRFFVLDLKKSKEGFAEILKVILEPRDKG